MHSPSSNLVPHENWKLESLEKWEKTKRILIAINSTEETSVAAASSLETAKISEYCIDSGATCHVCWDESKSSDITLVFK